ncbi:MAG: hypothetical protein A2234_02415 [Elusimicrobia bacterium RIFOXYA2_FULL_58_8]|nr:MAG: hypothetical protein A2285_09905 [Elusimicrobia bacterium RIFOXYA12_FULL_57_11]OGS13163.1 MAG: hypothetical protein A2234_02415 [Elusimicrobia bacterium RIFOXYA2_FULL_58_8]
MAKILFFNPPSRRSVYLETNVRVGAPSYPNLTLAALAGNLVKDHSVKIADLDLCADPVAALLLELEAFKPDMVASSANTPNYYATRELMTAVKEKYPGIRTVLGGVHATTMPEEVSAEKCFDVVVLGEGDTVIPELLSRDASGVPGIIYKDAAGAAVRTAPRDRISDINGLPFPAWELFRLDRYKNSRLSSRKNPVGLIETSRGCAFQCNYCNKKIFGSSFRVKSPSRVVAEMAHMLRIGFREIHIIDDSFTQDIARAKEICAEILSQGLKFPWSLFNGIRVDTVDMEFLTLAKKAGLWQVAFGIETGDEEVLKRINKRITLEQTGRAIRMAKTADLDTFGFFILGLSGETELSMQKTIAFAKTLPLDMAKFDICIPYPGTPYYQELKAQGRIKTENWARYICHQTDEPLFEHPNLAWPVITRYYKKAFREFYLRPSFFLSRFLRSLRKGDLLYDIQYFFKTKW